MSYKNFASVYDRLMTDVSYQKRTQYLLKLFKKHGKVPTLLLDLACGTGGFSNEFALKGIEVIGADMSEEMLSVARENSQSSGTNILFLCQRAEELDLYGTVDGAICCLDSLNHITNIKSLKQAIKRVSLFLEKDCLFIFDLNTEYKHREILSNNTFVIDQKDLYCVWQNRFNKKDLSVDISLDFFEKQNGGYKRSSEHFSERAYTENTLQRILKSAGLKTVAIYDDMSLKSPDKKSQRIIYVTQKI